MFSGAICCPRQHEPVPVHVHSNNTFTPSTLNAAMLYDIIALAAGMHAVQRLRRLESGRFAADALLIRLSGFSLSCEALGE
jgi:hypothetical protein